MRVVFMGTPEFAVPSLRMLDSTHDVVAVYTRPDSVSGRGAATRPSQVKTTALKLGLLVRQPATLRDAEEISALRALDADIIVVAAYGLILPRAALESARLGAVNAHASLLPRWRGAAPIQRAILAGDAVTGVSIMRVEEGLDTGPYCLQLQAEIADAGAVELTRCLAELGAQALLQALPLIADGTAQWTAQEESLVTYADKIAKPDVAISPEQSRTEVLRRIRASSPAAPSRIVVAGRGATVLAAQQVDATVAPGTVASTKSAVLLGLSDGAIEIIDLKPDGKAAMPASAWARGVHDLDGTRWAGAL